MRPAYFFHPFESKGHLVSGWEGKAQGKSPKKWGKDTKPAGGVGCSYFMFFLHVYSHPRLQGLLLKFHSRQIPPKPMVNGESSESEIGYFGGLLIISLRYNGSSCGLRVSNGTEDEETNASWPSLPPETVPRKPH
ncbi:hypothetical protein ZHAS_00017466 [Anopheles sinensis]|uniref:Uncharacterized protein n=1 Tax=Anopheles sinensis TaxID=74873 RepID=A0A084WGM5_ANOSI|nr:hypothetical protein ZHAS_00017466 [Anopheles sinensis]